MSKNCKVGPTSLLWRTLRGNRCDRGRMLLLGFVDITEVVRMCRWRWLCIMIVMLYSKLKRRCWLTTHYSAYLYETQRTSTAVWPLIDHSVVRLFYIKYSKRQAGELRRVNCQNQQLLLIIYHFALEDICQYSSHFPVKFSFQTFWKKRSNFWNRK